VDGSQYTTRERILISIAVMTATMMQLIDTTIVNVALPHMQGALGTTRDEISWVLTTYLVSSGIFMPLTGYFADKWGQRRFLLLSMSGFVISSMLCGLSISLQEIVLFRLAQGVFGAALVPLSQSIMVQIFPVEKRGQAMALWGVGVLLGPIIGPTLGGFLTQHLSWRWTFFVNLPVGLAALALAAAVVPDSPRRERGMDWAGFLYLAMAIGGLQFVLDRGNEDGWFASRIILLVSVVAVLGFLAFIDHALRKKDKALFNLSIFKDRNFTTASLLISAMGLGMYGATLLSPELLEGLLKYPALTSGLVLVPRGLVAMLTMMVVGRLIGKIDARILIGLGILIFSTGLFVMTRYNLNIDVFWAVWPMTLLGLGMGLIFPPVSTIAYATLPREMSSEAAGVFNLLRTIGSAVGISIVSTILTRQTQVSWNQLGGHINASNPALQHFLHQLGLSLHATITPSVLGLELSRQANMQGFIDSFQFMAWVFLATFPLLDSGNTGIQNSRQYSLA